MDKPAIIVQLASGINRLVEALCFYVSRWFHRARPWLAALLLSVTTACADGWTGRVVGVSDGDTLTVLRHGGTVSVRLDEIDAPELRQPYGTQSRKSLSGLCMGRYADVHELGRDKYGRTLARVACTGTDANAEQIRRGYAWFYTQYGRDPALRDLETSARQRRVGLWADPAPMPPWEFRHENRGGAGPRAGFGGGRCGAKKHCGEMASCDEAIFYLSHCGLAGLDRNRDGVPCESLCR